MDKPQISEKRTKIYGTICYSTWKRTMKKVPSSKKKNNNPPKSENIEIETGWWQPLQK